jgi:hypothetical protein
MTWRSVLFGLALAVLASTACWGDDDDAPPAASVTPAGQIATSTAFPEGTSTPRPTSTPAATPAAMVEGGLQYNGFQLFGEFTYAAPIEFPENLMLLVETGCSQCDGPTRALYRVWRNAGETHVELLIDASISDHENAEILGFALTPDTSTIVVSVCTAGICPRLGGLDPESQMTLYRSSDGGATWSALLTTGPGEAVFPRAITPDGIVVEDISGDGPRYLDGGAIEVPAGAGQLQYESRRVGALQWDADDGSRIVDAKGATIAVVEPGGRIGSLAYDPREGEPRPVISWREDGRTEPGWLITRMRDDNSLAGFNSVEYVMPAVILSDSSVLGLLTLAGSLIGGTVGYIDVERGVLTPIAGALIEEPFGDGQLAMGRNALQAAIEGPFLRVTTSTPCVDIHADTTVQSEVLTCAVDGVLVHDLDSSVTVGQQTWQHVRLLDGREGYAASEHVTE